MNFRRVVESLVLLEENTSYWINGTQIHASGGIPYDYIVNNYSTFGFSNPEEVKDMKRTERILFGRGWIFIQTLNRGYETVIRTNKFDDAEKRSIKNWMRSVTLPEDGSVIVYSYRGERLFRGTVREMANG